VTSLERSLSHTSKQVICLVCLVGTRQHAGRQPTPSSAMPYQSAYVAH